MAGSRWRRRATRPRNTSRPMCTTSRSTRLPGSRRIHPMHTSSLVIDKARELAGAGRHTEVIACLGAREANELEQSPDLALLYGTAHARIGRHDEGRRWLDVALDEARKRNEQAIERRALNARGAVALVSGRLDEAADFCTRALMLASRDSDVATAGRCSNNLGIISHLRGRHAEAIASWEIALAAFDGAAWRPGVAHCHHNLGLTYRDQGALDRALTEADWAVTEAEASGDHTLWALALRGRAEIRVAQGEIGLARRALDEVRAIRSRVPDPADEAEDQRALADAGDYAELVTYLGGRTQDELEQSPMLALLSGIGHSRLGRLDVGQQWAMVALSRARVLGDRTLEVRGLNVCGAIALERGGISEATSFFTRAQDEAMQDNDMATLGRCANNLGIIANMQGDYGRAVGAYTRAIAAYQKARNDRGIAETQHNLGITYREQGRLDDAMHATDTAMRAAERLGDRRLKAQALAVRAESQVARGDPELAIREAQRAVVIHRDLKDAVRETEDLRILAVALGAAGRKREAEAMFREVIARAAKHERTLLVAIAQRDLASLLAREGKIAAAREVAETARATLERLGAKAEAEKLDALLEEPYFSGDYAGPLAAPARAPANPEASP